MQGTEEEDKENGGHSFCTLLNNQKEEDMEKMMESEYLRRKHARLGNLRGITEERNESFRESSNKLQPGFGVTKGSRHSASKAKSTSSR